jgi:hypothetical protein
MVSAHAFELGVLELGFPEWLAAARRPKKI